MNQEERQAIAKLGRTFDALAAESSWSPEAKALVHRLAAECRRTLVADANEILNHLGSKPRG